MPTNVTFQYQKAEEEYLKAKTKEEKIACLKKMLTLAPGHKGAENLRSSIKQRLSKLKYAQEKDIKQTKRSAGISIKREGVAQVVLVGKTNAGKSLLLNRLTNAKVKEGFYEYTTKKPVFGIMDYNGIKVQIIEIPAITNNFNESETGPALFGIVRMANLIVFIVRNEEELNFLKKEFEKAEMEFDGLIVFNSDEPIKNYYTLDFKNDDVEDIKQKIWSRLNKIYVFTKQPGRKKDYPPVALEKGDNIETLALKVHKDFVKKFRFARIWGPSARFNGQEVGLSHILKEEDIIEFHMK